MSGVQISPKGVEQIFGGKSWPEVCDEMMAGEIPEPFDGMRAAMDSRYPGAQTAILIDPDAPWVIMFHLFYSEIEESAVILKTDLPSNQN